MKITWGTAYVGTALALCACGHPSIGADCNMNGRGDGRCDFTNTGTGMGAQCVVLRVSDRRGLGSPIESEPVCSGDLRASETRNVAFTLSGVDRLCSASAAEIENGQGRKSWGEYCEIGQKVVR